MDDCHRHASRIISSRPRLAVLSQRPGGKEGVEIVKKVIAWFLRRMQGVAERHRALRTIASLPRIFLKPWRMYHSVSPSSSSVLSRSAFT